MRAIVPRKPPTIGATALQAQSSGGFSSVLKWIVVAFVVVGGGYAGWRAWQHFSGRARDEVYEPEHPVNLAKVDLEEVHYRLWGRWAGLVERKHRLRNPEASIAAAEKELRDAIAPDENLSALFDELAEIVREGNLRDGSKRKQALWLTRAWNQYLDRNDAPYFLKAFVALDPNPEFHLYAYEVVGRTSGAIDGDEERIRFLSRLDEVNRVEWYHASTPTEEAVVRVDWVVQFVLDQVWPLFGAPDPKFARKLAFRDAVLAEARGALSEKTIAVLEKTGDTRAAAVRAHAEIRERRSCSGYAIGRLPWDGFDGDVLMELYEVKRGGRCPPVYPSEYTALDEARNALTEAQGLEEALQELVAWAARIWVVHELKHLEVGVDIYDEGMGKTCSTCAKDMTNPARAEVAAIVAEWAWSGAPATALFRRCWRDEVIADGPLEAALEGLDHHCADGPLDGLEARARELEEEVLGGSTELTVADGVDEPLPLDRSVVQVREARN